MHLGFLQQAARWTVLSAAFLVLHPSSASGSPDMLASRESPGEKAGAERLTVPAGGKAVRRLPPRRVPVGEPDRSGAKVPATKHAPSGEILPRVGRPLAGEVFLPPVLPAKGESRSGYGPAGAGFWDGSEYMLGRIGVAVILVESDGSSEPSTEDWTEAEENRVLAEIERAGDWWRRRAPSGFLSFTYEFHTGVPVSCEPIRHPQSEEALWIGGALEALGWGGADRFTGTQNLLNEMKARLDLDWAFAIYVVDSSEDPDGMFADGVYFAYAYLGGPFLVLTLDNDGWGIDNFASVCAHEMGHIFYALDQYASARVPCDRTSGYLDRETTNSEYGDCPEEEPECIMRSRPLGGATLSATAIGQIGWADEDADGIPDVIDTAPVVEARADEENGNRIAGRASVNPVRNRNPYGYGHDLSINTIEAVEFRVDGGDWVAADPEDGVWGGPDEQFSFSLAGLAGAHLVEVRARNSVENLSPAASLEWTAPGGTHEPWPQAESPPKLRAAGNRPNPFNPSTRVYFEVPAAGRGEASVFDARGVLVRVLLDGEVDRGENVLEWDGKDRNGRDAPSGRYFCRVRAGGEIVVFPMTLLR